MHCPRLIYLGTELKDLVLEKNMLDNKIQMEGLAAQVGT